MKTLNIDLTDREHKIALRKKGNRTWREYVMGHAERKERAKHEKHR